MMLAEASNAFTGEWIYAAAAIIGLIIAVGSYFATRREVDELKKQFSETNKELRALLDRLDASETRLDRSNESRISGLHNRLNPLEVKVAHSDGQMEAFAESFEKFTRIIEATSRQRDDQVRAFTDALTTFATVLRENKK